ncbi:NmrA-like family domain-containing protein [Lachnellula hyalina]|uniref:NmrA-like family domain-containing protein n=1 Tax=Lachnellula hyalina TaxID=1316788 RepID=A0A8H8R4T1_9HELO|nr:NmrA-like family domain-containing protein [Lachnellula hyalina]TVY28036.1 NmrA-like family domain-containing protein [Lachnellula hyalina]
MTKLLTVFGATGQQGGSLIDYVLKNPELSNLYHLRGITRDASKASATSLKERGVQVIQADLSDSQSLVSAVADSYAVFGVTNYWDKGSAAIEIAQGKAIADAALAASVTLLIWSSLPNVSRMTRGALTDVAHFDSKAEVEEYIRNLPILSSFFMAGWYMQNHISYMRPKLQDNGSVVLSQTWSPTALLPMIDITDTGKFVAPILLDPAKYSGKSFTCATFFYTPLELVGVWTKITGKKVTYAQVGADQARGNLTAEMQRKLKKSVGLIDDYSYFGPTGREDLKWTLDQLTDAPNTWESFVNANEPWFS